MSELTSMSVKTPWAMFLQAAVRLVNERIPYGGAEERFDGIRANLSETRMRFFRDYLQTDVCTVIVVAFHRYLLDVGDLLFTAPEMEDYRYDLRMALLLDE
ncbi:MAG: hypothetical protein GY696_11285 [Gammaproteobacteria bacterium]|nr:hypothetical protein [Gammaproteobacteria bacterium]